jgi:hypothetical protein
MFITSKNYAEQIRSLIKRSARIDMAVAFWGKGSDSLLPEGLENTSRIVCNLASGGTNPTPIVSLMNRGFKVKQLDDLHDKVVIGSSAAIVGSANHSTNGLQLECQESAGWSEAGFLTDSAEHLVGISDWFSAEWTRARKITSKDIEAAQRAWKTRFKNRPLVSSTASFIDMSKTDLLGREVYAVLWSAPVSEAANRVYEDAMANAKGSAQLQTKTINSLSFYEDWPGLPKDASLVSFQGQSDGTYVCDGIWRRFEEADEILERRTEGPQLQLVLRQTTILGLPVAPKDLAKLTKMLAPHLHALKEKYADGVGAVIPMHEIFP